MLGSVFEYSDRLYDDRSPTLAVKHYQIMTLRFSFAFTISNDFVNGGLGQDQRRLLDSLLCAHKWSKLPMCRDNNGAAAAAAACANCTQVIYLFYYGCRPCPALARIWKYNNECNFYLY